MYSVIGGVSLIISTNIVIVYKEIKVDIKTERTTAENLITFRNSLYAFENNIL